MAVTELLQREINRGKGKPQSRRLEFAQHILRAFALTRSERIRKRSDFQAAYRLGRRFNSRHFVVIARINGLNHTRIGLSVSKKKQGLRFTEIFSSVEYAKHFEQTRSSFVTTLLIL
jgi:hypothetical protein